MSASHPHGPPSFDALWLAEALRLQEARSGPLDDEAESLEAQRIGGDFAQRILTRSALLATKEGLHARLQHWQALARVTFAALAIIAMVTGAGMALGALGDGTRAVNLMQALVVLLGLHTLMYLFWVVTAALPASRPTGLGATWLWLTGRLAGSAQQALTGQALVSTLQRARSTKPLLGSLTHAIWTLAFIAATLALLGLLSARQYFFQWETTLLQPEFFITLTRVLGWLPSVLGFNTPDDLSIRQSIGGAADAQAGAGPLWSQWLIGCVITYGLIPRLVSFLGCFAMVRYRLKQQKLDTRLPGFIELRPRLMPDSRNTGVDAPAPDLTQVAQGNTQSPAITPGGHNAIVGIELPGDIRWPIETLAALGHDLGRIDTRSQRQQLENTLAAKQFDHLIAVCDGRQTPDRGTMLYLRSLASTCQHLHLLVLPPDTTDTSNRTTLWQQTLEHNGFSPALIHIGLAAFKARTGTY